MKSKLNASMLVAFFAILTSTSCAQKLATELAPQAGSANAAQFKKDVANPVYANDVSTKVLRSFYNSYGEISGAIWLRSAEGYSVTFNYDGIKNTVYYKTNGVVDAKILYYSEDRMSQSLRHFVKSRFYDYAITYITEVHKNDATAFYVKVEDASFIKTLKIVDDEYEIVESLTK